VLWLKWSVNAHVRKCSSGTRNKRKAEQSLAQKIAETRTGQYMGPKVEKVMVVDLLDGLVTDYKDNGKDSLPDVMTRWEKHIKPFFKLMRAVDVDTPTIKRYRVHRKDEDASNASINREVAALKRMFTIGREDKKVTHMPVFPKQLEENNIRKGFVEDHDYDKLAAACAMQGLWMRALFEAGYQLGWRVSELLGLRVKQVDLLNRTIRLEPGETKNGKGRNAPIFDRLYPWIEQSCVGKDKDRYVFSRDSDGVRPISDMRGTW